MPIAWLAGARRTGKTVLARSLPDTEFLDCDLPVWSNDCSTPSRSSVRCERRTRCSTQCTVHQLPHPCRVLEIAADEFPKLRLLATGSSTLAATRKFRDSLTGRKRVVRLCPSTAHLGLGSASPEAQRRSATT